MVEFQIKPNNISSFNPRTREMTKWTEYSPSIRLFKEGKFFSVDMISISKILDIDATNLEKIIKENDGFVLTALPHNIKISRIKTEEGAKGALKEIHKLCALSHNNEYLTIEENTLVIDKKKDLYICDFTNMDEEVHIPAFEYGYKFNIDIKKNDNKYNSQYVSEWYGLPFSLYQEIVLEHNGLIEFPIFNTINEIKFRNLIDAYNCRDALTKLCLMCLAGNVEFEYINGKAQIII